MAKSSSAKKISPAREAAFAVLERVATTQAHSDDLLHGPGMNALSQADKNLATTLVLGVLRWQIALDARIKPLLKQPELQMASPVQTALRMGLFQLLHLDRIPAHAALSESVELVCTAGHGHASGMVNAILRKVTRQDAPKPKLFETTAAFAERLAHPAWLVERWVKNYGRAEALAICEYGQREPAQGALFAIDETMPIPTMDDGSRLVAELAAASVDAPKRIWDCCAAPGGKTLVMSRRQAGVELLASDANPKRVKGLAERLRDVAGVRVVEADAVKLSEDEGEFDLILCDVPCSGTGTLGRNPEIKQRLQPAELSRQAKRQREILAAALGRLAPGGRLVYSTCSLEPEENERVVEEVLAAARGVSEMSLELVLERLGGRGVFADGVEAKGLMRGGRLRTLPGMGFQGDGFFASLLTR